MAIPRESRFSTRYLTEPSGPSGKADARPVPTAAPSILAVTTQSSSPAPRQSGISCPRISPLLLPKSEMVTSGPCLLIPAKGELATSMPMKTASTRSAVSASDNLVVPGFGADPSLKTNSASAAPKPLRNISPVATSSAAAVVILLANIGPGRRFVPSLSSQGELIRPTFQPATGSPNSAMAASWMASAPPRSAGSTPG